MSTSTGGAEMAPMDTATRSERQVGPETLAVRIFREVFAQTAMAHKALRPALDRYLKLVIDNPQAKRGDKTYARKIYTDLLRQHGEAADAKGDLPDWAKKQDENVLSDQDIQEILSAADNPPPIIAPTFTQVVVDAAKDPDFSMTATDAYHTHAVSVTIRSPVVIAPAPAPAMAVDPLDSLLEAPPEPPLHPLQVQCQKFLDELMITNEMPFVRVFTAASPVGRYIALGTVLGTVNQGKHLGKKVNIHCTIAGYRRLRDAENDHFVFINGRALVVSGDDPRTGLRKHIFCLRHTPGLKIRYWTRINDRDENDLARFYVLTLDGARQITRDQF
jgi:hypothetical protein